MNISEQFHMELLNLNQLSVYLSDPNRDDMQVLRKSSEISSEILRTIRLVAEKPYNKELIEFLDKVNPILDSLCNSAKRMNPKPPSKGMLSTVTEAFSSYVDQITPKQGIKKIREIAAYVPYINSIVDCCGTIPRYWNKANRNEKIALTLAATLLLTSVALTIAFYASPALAAVPLIGLAIAGISAMASACYEQALINPRKKEQKSADIKNILTALELQKKSVNEMLVVDATQHTMSPPVTNKAKRD